eukprot:753508-Hanusia_phi.AAC.1
MGTLIWRYPRVPVLFPVSAFKLVGWTICGKFIGGGREVGGGRLKVEFCTMKVSYPSGTSNTCAVVHLAQTASHGTIPGVTSQVSRIRTCDMPS